MIGSFPLSCGVSGELDIMWLDFIRSALGDFLGKNDTTYSYSETVIIARLFASLQKISESLVSEAFPNTASDMLYNWAIRLGVPVNEDDDPDTIRALCNAKYRLNDGPTEFNLNATITEILGDRLEEIIYHYSTDGYLSPAPTFTYDSYINPYTGYGTQFLTPDDYQVSERAHITLSVNMGTLTEEDFFRLISVQLRNILELLLPCWATWDWTIGTSGFILALDQTDTGGSLLDFTAL